MGRIASRKLQGDVGIGFFDIQTEREDDFYWLIRRSKLRILAAVEVKNRIVVKAISQIVDGIKPDFVRQMINGHVSSSAHITIADGGERGFKKLAKEYGSLTVYYSWDISTDISQVSSNGLRLNSIRGIRLSICKVIWTNIISESDIDEILKKF